MTQADARALAQRCNLMLIAAELDHAGRPLLWVCDAQGKDLTHQALIARLNRAGYDVTMTHNEPGRREGVGLSIKETGHEHE